MRIGVLTETGPREQRVALTPSVVESLNGDGHTVYLEIGAGARAGFRDDDYGHSGANLVDRATICDRAEIIVTVDGTSWYPPPGNDLTLIGLMDPLNRANDLALVAKANITVLALDLIPRTTRAQSMDVLSSMATVAGYQAALVAAQRLAKIFPLMMTAGGTVPPARVLVLGAGVAGLQAIATCRRLGAVVEAYDIRPAAQEQIQSVGARALDLSVEADQTETSGGYAAAQSDQLNQTQAELLAPHIAGADVVISTASIPGQLSPELISEQALDQMKPGSVVIDLAAANGGNTRLSRPDQEIIHNGVIILGPTDLASQGAATSSQLFANNVLAFIRHLCPSGDLVIDPDDDITGATLVTTNGEITNPMIKERVQP